MAYGLEKAIDWENVLENKRVVIIAEAGAGKTHELLHKAKELHENGKPAFFMRLEYLKDGLESAFENLGDNDYLDFATWKQSDESGYIFLDSVDEAKLSDPREFERALRRLRMELGTSLAQATIVVSSRPTFQPKTELQLL